MSNVLDFPINVQTKKIARDAINETEDYLMVYVDAEGEVLVVHPEMDEQLLQYLVRCLDGYAARS